MALSDGTPSDRVRRFRLGESPTRARRESPALTRKSPTRARPATVFVRRRLTNAHESNLTGHDGST